MTESSSCAAALLRYLERRVPRDGSILCHANGGATGGGDGRCPDFLIERKAGEIIWRDT